MEHRTCGDCAWQRQTTRAVRCRQAGRRIDPAGPACERFEPAASLDCQACAACCRAAYDVVLVSRRDPVRRAHPELVIEHNGSLELLRAGDRCAALEGPPYACSIYHHRPRTCRDFARAGPHCLTARRRIDLSR